MEFAVLYVYQVYTIHTNTPKTSTIKIPTYVHIIQNANIIVHLDYKI